MCCLVNQVRSECHPFKIDCGAYFWEISLGLNYNPKQFVSVLLSDT